MTAHRGEPRDPAWPIRLPAPVAKDLERWRSHPELANLTRRLSASADEAQFLDILAEVVIARHLGGKGCELRVEIPTPSGRSCDLEVKTDALTFYLHIKRLGSIDGGVRRLKVSSKLRVLERIARPYVVGVRWREAASSRHMTRLVRESEQFLLQARVGDELVVRDDGGQEIGGCRVLAAWDGDRVSVVIGLPSGFSDQSPRVQRLLRKAHQQFMPRALNLVLICSTRRDDRVDVENALLGSHVERWDLLPPRGHRVAHGRADDGFWSGQKFNDSQVAGWFQLSLAADVNPRLWFREPATLVDAVRDELMSVFAGD
jgi:hypothetical protein